VRTFKIRALVPGVVLFSGCALIGGGAGEFVVEGETYRTSRVECARADGQIVAALTSGAAAMHVTVLDQPDPTVVMVFTGQRGGPPLLEMADDRGRAEVVRTGDAYEVTGVLLHTQHSQNAATGEEEEFSATFTCTRYAEAE